ncbi:MAG TPA: Co2+/Mg2+ efflux protein ApaG [Gammaproteobacteria bacterium]|nr:Co2+/Mg2+ efflux protein ApaG [Gammaproteobacteria bacterium]
MSDKQICQMTIDVETAYIDEQSDPDNNRYVFSYTITIRNTGDVAAKLMTRHWIITDANNFTQEVKGDGVVGEQPHLKPGEGFQYTSGTVLDTPIGSMRGSYQMLTSDDTYFDAEIPTFTLSKPNALH